MATVIDISRHVTIHKIPTFSDRLELQVLKSSDTKALVQRLSSDILTQSIRHV